MAESTEIINLNIDEIPQIIVTQFADLAGFHDQIEIARQRAIAAKETADSVSVHTKGLGKSKTGIDLLQKSTSELADSQMVIIEAQQLSFQYQEKLAKVIQFLFGLGTASLASNRAVIKKLEIMISSNGEVSLDELAQQEVVNLVKQLKAQEDIMQKQAALEQKVKGQAQTNDEQTIEIKRQALKDTEHDRLLQENEQTDTRQDEIINHLQGKVKKLTTGLIIGYGVAIIAIGLAIIAIVI